MLSGMSGRAGSAVGQSIAAWCSASELIAFTFDNTVRGAILPNQLSGDPDQGRPMACLCRLPVHCLTATNSASADTCRGSRGTSLRRHLRRRQTRQRVIFDVHNRISDHRRDALRRSNI